MAILVIFPSVSYGKNVFASSIPNQVRTLTQTPIYSESDIKSEIIKNSQNKDVYLSENTILNVDTTFANTMFYKVLTFGIVDNATQNDYGFVLISQTLDANITSPEQKLDTNAIVKNDNSPIYNYNSNDQTYSQTDVNLSKDTKVRILNGYDSSKTYTYISYQKQNGEICYGYIRTLDLSVNGVNYSVIVAISILVVCASILLIVFGIKGKKKHKK